MFSEQESPEVAAAVQLVREKYAASGEQVGGVVGGAVGGVEGGAVGGTVGGQSSG